MRFSFSFDDGHELDRKIIEILRDYKGIDVTFFVPIKSWGFKNISIYKDYKVGGHTWSHPTDLKLLDDIELNVEILMAKKTLDIAVGYKTNIFCYPRGRYNEKVLKYVKKAGYKYGRTTQIGFGCKDNDKLQLRGLHMFQRKEYEGKDWIDFIKDFCGKNYHRWLHIWGHSWEIEKYNEWKKFSNLLAFLTKSEIKPYI